MRNLLQYPVTKEEIVLYLKELQKEVSEEIISQGICGDMRDLLLEEAIKIIQASGPYNFKL